MANVPKSDAAKNDKRYRGVGIQPPKPSAVNTLKSRIDAAKDIPSQITRAAKGALSGDSDEMHTGAYGAIEDARRAVLPQYKQGTDYVPETGPAVLHKGEAVLNKKDADAHRKEKNMRKDMALAESSLAYGKKESKGKEEHKSDKKKTVREMHIRKGHSGGYIARHEHDQPEHPSEEHVLPNQDALMEHVMQHMGEPNPGEAEADAGQSGIPGEEQAAAAPQAGPQGA